MKKGIKNLLMEIRSFDAGKAMSRSRQRNGFLSFLKVILMLGFAQVIFMGLFNCMWLVHVYFYPAHEGKFYEFWREGISPLSFISSFLMVMPLIFAAIPLGMILANCVLFSIPFVRRLIEQETETVKGKNFGESMSDIFIICVFFVPVCLVLSLIGAVTLSDLR